MQQIISYKAPKMQPLPGEITDARVRGAILPVHIETARAALVLCETLPELLTYRNSVEGLAAAVRVMKHVAPEMVRSANEMVADAWRKGGRLLLAYHNTPQSRLGKHGRAPSERTVVAKGLGLSTSETSALVRVAQANESAVYAAMSKSRNLKLVATKLPRARGSEKYGRKHTYGVLFSQIMGAAAYGGMGLTRIRNGLAAIGLDNVRALAPDEKKLVRAKVAEIMELLDAIDQAAT